MQNPIRTLLRKIALRRNQSKLPHSILPLSIITHATILVDASKEDAAQTCGAVKQFFEYRQIPLDIYCPKEEDLDFIGTIKKKHRKPVPEGSVELFICLIEDQNSFLAEYESRRSKAAFKLGRCEYDDGLFDITLFVPEDVDASQSAVFSSIKNYLNIIK